MNQLRFRPASAPQNDRLNFSSVKNIKVVVKKMVRIGRKTAKRAGRWRRLPLTMILASLVLKVSLVNTFNLCYVIIIGKDKSKPNTYSEYTLADNRRRKPQNCAHKLRGKPHCFGDRGRQTSHLWRWPTWQTLSWRRDTHQPLHTSTFHTLSSKMNIKEWAFASYTHTEGLSFLFRNMCITQ